MNGDVGKPPSGTMFTSGADSGVSTGPCEYLVINGIAEGAEGLSPITPSAPQDSTLQSYSLTQLKQMLSQQLEYYFSRENLANDTYLLSQMDNDQYVPIWTVANFNQVKKLTKDIKLITEVLRESPNVQVDEDGVKVRPNHKRCIVILREIPDTTPLEEVKNLFSGENCPRFISCEFAHNSSWYVTFESDDDAQRAYRYLREEVQEFQGKPIMARIKAKPMNRLPLPPVAVKNGFRTTPPPTAVYDPAAFPPGQQRFIYTNGTPGQPVTFNHVPVYQPSYGTQQFYAWPATSAPGYLDISSVFSVNGLAPQTFKPNPYRPNNTRPRKISRVGITNEQVSQSISSASGNQSKTQPLTQVPSSHSTLKVKVSSSSDTNRTNLVHGIGDNSEAHSGHIPVGVPVINSEGLMDVYRYMPAPINLVTKDIVAPRHRRKKEREDTLLSSQNIPNQRKESKLIQFDLVDEAFPPLPGLEAGTHSLLTQSQILNSNVDSPQSQVTADGQPQNQWGENRLADVVKGTAKSKNGNKEIGNLGEVDSSRANSPIQCNQILSQNSTSCFAGPRDREGVNESVEVLLSTVTLTPPSSPEKIVPASLPVKCTMADKSTKTDDVLLNGDLDSVLCPTTTNAATMTTVLPASTATRPTQVEICTSIKGQISSHKPDVRCQTPSPSNDCPSIPQRKSYAQVTQHPKDLYAQKDKQVKVKGGNENPSNSSSAKISNLTVCNNSNNVNVNRTQSDSGTRENGQQRESCNHVQKNVGSNRNSSRSAHERSQRKRVEARTSQLRDFVRPQSPK